MAESSEKIRNIALMAHSGAGKTSMAEAMLFNAGMTNRLGRVEDGNTLMDFEPEELKRGSSVSSSFYQYEWKKHELNLIDTPGEQNFFTDTKLCLQAADALVVAVDAIDGVKVQTEIGWGFAENNKQPVLVYVNKMDRERADLNQALEDIKQSLAGPTPMLMQLPIGKEADFKGVVDLVKMKAFTYGDDGKAQAGDIPSDMQADVDAAREAFVENIAEADDELLERYLEGETITDEEINAVLRNGIASRALAPVMCGSATGNIGMDLLADFIVECMPSPADRGPFTGSLEGSDDPIERSGTADEPFSALVVKTVADPYAGRLSIFRVLSGTLGGDGNIYNSTKSCKERFSQLLVMAGKEQKTVKGAVAGSIVTVAKLKDTFTGDTLCDEGSKIIYPAAQPMPTLMSFALEAKSKGDEDKIYTALQKILEEDKGLTMDRNSETKEILLSGLGQVHIETTVEKMKRKFGVEVQLEIPKIPFRETIKKKVRVQGRHKKQTGGHGQFGDCWVQLEPRPRGEGYEFVDAIVGGAIPRTYIPAVDKGIQEASLRGILAGNPVIDFKATLDDGSFHAVDSSEMAFKIAGSLAFRNAAEQAKPVLLEPIMDVTVTTPDECMGDIMGDLNSRRGRVLGMDSAGKNQVIKAKVPLAEFQTYAPDLNSMTGGRGIYTMEFSHYDEVPAQTAEKIIEAYKKSRE